MLPQVDDPMTFATLVMTLLLCVAVFIGGVALVLSWRWCPDCWCSHSYLGSLLDRTLASLDSSDC